MENKINSQVKTFIEFNRNSIRNFKNLFKFYVDYMISVNYNMQLRCKIRNYLESIDIPNIIHKKIKHLGLQNTTRKINHPDNNISSISCSDINITLTIFDLLFPNKHIYKLKFLCNYIHSAENTIQHNFIYNEIDKLKDVVPLRNYFHIINHEITSNVFCYHK